MPHKDPEANRKYHRERKRRLRRERGAKPNKVFVIGERVPDSHLTYSGITDPKEYTSVSKLKHLWTCECGRVIKRIQGEVLRKDGKGTKCCGEQGCPYVIRYKNRRFEDESIDNPIKPSHSKPYVKLSEDIKRELKEDAMLLLRDTCLAERTKKGRKPSYGKHRVSHAFFGKIYSFGGFDTNEEACRVSREVIDYFVQHNAVPLHLVKVRRKLRIGDIFGHLTYRGLKPQWDNSKAHRPSLWECDCGREELFECPANSVISGNTRSCGCAHYEHLEERWAEYRSSLVIGKKVADSRLTFRGLSNRRSNASKLYGLWDCECGRKGIEILITSVCRLVEPQRSCGCLTREATAERNKQNTKFITHNGQTLSKVQWAKQLGISESGLKARLRRMELAKALSPQDLRGGDVRAKSENSWTTDQIDYLKANFIPATRGNLDSLAAGLGKTRSAVSKKIWELGLTKARQGKIR